MSIVRTHLLVENEPIAHSQQIYNGLDTCVTLECFEEITRLHPTLPPFYSFQRALQAPALEMMLRGFKVDELARRAGAERLRGQIAKMEAQLNILAQAVWDQDLNANSPAQLKKFFYGVMKLPEVWLNFKGERKLSTNREALERLEVYFHARPIVSTILAVRDLVKQLSVLETEIDPDGRMRTSYNIAGTETSRWSSSSNAHGTGTNLQNIAGDLRDMLIADGGYKLVGIDLEQAESREVGWLCGVLFGDWSYLDACYAGDLHTLVCRGGWPDLDWPDDAGAARRLADEVFYRQYSRRDLAKKLGHGSNYYGQPATMAKHAKITKAMAEQFQRGYFAQFPGIQKYHRWTAQQLQTKSEITNPWGLSRTFFGRANDDSTLREAIAFNPQSSTALRMNLILWRIWKYMPQVQLLGQVHDAVYFQFPIHLDETTVVQEALSYFSIPITHDGHQLIVPGEASTGWNWGKYSPSNPLGLKKFKLGVPDVRVRPSRLTSIQS
jgi:DNA polymerase I-like protein with 3'-5' exonuclease and polymerase domains